MVVISAPGAFTPTCHANHIPAFVKHASDFAGKGYDVYVIAANDVFVMSAWGRTEGAKDKIHFASDVNLAFSKGLGATIDMSAAAF